jgi:peptide/nickel transport system ATP-binding protein
MTVPVQAEITVPAPLLRLEDVEVTYRRPDGVAVRAVRGASLDVNAGEVVGLVGESGCGKSSLGRAAVGLERLTAGSVSFQGQPVTALGRHPRPAALRPLQLLFQDPYSSLNPRRKVGHQLADGLRASGEAATRARIEELLDLVAMPSSAADHYPHEFSGGQRQRLAIGRALAARPLVLIADEPVSALDASAQATIVTLLGELRDETGIGILFISHDLGVVRQIAQKVAVMYLGKIVESGAIDAVWRRPRHPYTEALIAAAPVADGAGRLPGGLAGEVPDPSAPPSGCSFHPRCPVAEAECTAVDPPPLRIDDDHVGNDRAAGDHVARCLFALRPAPSTARDTDKEMSS